MRHFLKYIVFSFIAITFCTCQTEDKFNYLLQAKDGGNMKIGTTISYLGIEVGQVTAIKFANIKGEDFVLASIELMDKNILNKSSFISWSSYGVLEIINTSAGELLEENDTIKLSNVARTIPIQQNNVITPISSKEIYGKEKELLSPEDQKKLDSLQMKINKLNNLIQEVNDQD